MGSLETLSHNNVNWPHEGRAGLPDPVELIYFSKNPQHKNLNLKNKRHLRLTHQLVLKHQTGLWEIKRKRINKNPR